jgi:hypothetical protein
VLSGAVVDAADSDGVAALGAAHVFAQFPFALLVPIDQE